MSMQNLMDNFNTDLMKEVNRPNVIETGTYTAQVADAKTKIVTNQKTGEERTVLALTLNLFREEIRAGMCWLDICPVEQRSKTGKLLKEAELFYKLAKVLGASDMESMIEKLPGAVISVYGTELYMARNSDMPAQFKDNDKPETAWIKVYVNEGDETKREILLDAELKPRFEVQRVGQHRG